MKKALAIAQREFLAAAGTKAFIFGILVTPVMLGVTILALPRLMHEEAPKIEGRIAIIDTTGEIAVALGDYLRPERIAQRQQDEMQRVQEVMPPALRAATRMPGSKEKVDAALAGTVREVPTLHVELLPPSTDVEAQKGPLKESVSAHAGTPPRLALVVVHADAVVRAPGRASFGTYDLYIRNKLDDRLVGEITDGLHDAIVDARVRAAGLDRETIEALTRVDRVHSRTVTASGEDTTNQVLNQIMPVAFMILLLVSVMLSGQYLLTTTVEEKSNRIVEVLLAAVSPMELMVGKILGQLAVGLLVLSLYLGLGVLGLVSSAAIGLLDPLLLVFLFVFFLLAYVSVGALMAAIGAAVNEMREAQALMTPVMLLITMPMVLWLPISRDPSSPFATVLSFVPPLSNFVMMLRMASTTPPPLWQPLVAVVVGALSSVGMLWFAARVFRVGLLMYGKPPSFRTLLRWARMG